MDRRSFLTSLPALFILLHSRSLSATESKKLEADLEFFRSGARQLLRDAKWKSRLSKFDPSKISEEELRARIAKDYSGELYQLKNWWMSETEVLLLLSLIKESA